MEKLTSSRPSTFSRLGIFCPDPQWTGRENVRAATHIYDLSLRQQVWCPAKSKSSMWKENVFCLVCTWTNVRSVKVKFKVKTWFDKHFHEMSLKAGVKNAFTTARPLPSLRTAVAKDCSHKGRQPENNNSKTAHARKPISIAHRRDLRIKLFEHYQGVRLSAKSHSTLGVCNKLCSNQLKHLTKCKKRKKDQKARFVPNLFATSCLGGSFAQN